MISEFYPIGLKRCGVKPEQYLKTLQDQGFQIFNANEKEGKIQITGVEELLEKYKETSEDWTNIFCVRDG